MLSKAKGTSDDENIKKPIMGLQVTKFLRTFFVAEKIVITFLCITCGELFVNITNATKPTRQHRFILSTHSLWHVSTNMEAIQWI